MSHSHIQIISIYPFSHNHGSVENHPKWKETSIGGTHFTLNHDYGRNGNSGGGILKKSDDSRLANPKIQDISPQKMSDSRVHITPDIGLPTETHHGNLKSQEKSMAKSKNLH